MKERKERFPCLELLKRMKHSFDDPGKVDENWEAPKSRSADDKAFL
jgi:hypothetical protein